MNGSEYVRLVRLYGSVIDHLKGHSPADTRLVRAQELAGKALGHAVAIYSLANGTDVKPVFGVQGTYIHLVSLNVLTRALLETYLLFHHIFLDSDGEDEFEFRYCAWQLKAGRKRERFAQTIPLQTEEGKKGWDVQKKVNKELRDRVRETEKFKSHSESTQERILQGRWQFPRWIDMAGEAGIDRHYREALYALLSDYAHSGGISTNQMGTSLSNTDRLELASMALRHAQCLVSRMLLAYTDLLPEAREAFGSDLAAFRVAQISAATLEKSNGEGGDS